MNSICILDISSKDKLRHRLVFNSDLEQELYWVLNCCSIQCSNIIWKIRDNQDSNPGCNERTLSSAPSSRSLLEVYQNGFHFISGSSRGARQARARGAAILAGVFQVQARASDGRRRFQISRLSGILSLSGKSCYSIKYDLKLLDSVLNF